MPPLRIALFLLALGFLIAYGRAMMSGTYISAALMPPWTPINSCRFSPGSKSLMVQSSFINKV